VKITHAMARGDLTDSCAVAGALAGRADGQQRGEDGAQLLGAASLPPVPRRTFPGADRTYLITLRGHLPMDVRKKLDLNILLTTDC
jgi:hypothetical protein